MTKAMHNKIKCNYSKKTEYIVWWHSNHRCDLGVTSLFLKQRAGVRSPIGSISRWRFFPRFPHLFIPSKSATLFPEFTVEDLRLGRTTTLVPEFCCESPAIGQNTLMMMIPSAVRQMSGYLDHIRPRLSYIIRLRKATVSDGSCCTWQSLNNKQQHLCKIS